MNSSLTFILLVLLTLLAPPPFPACAQTQSSPSDKPALLPVPPVPSIPAVSTPNITPPNVPPKVTQPILPPLSIPPMPNIPPIPDITQISNLSGVQSGGTKLNSILITGNKRISTEDLLQAAAAPMGEILSQQTLQDIMDRIQLYCIRSGHPEAEVNGISNAGKLNVTVREGPRKLIRAIHFKGLMDVSVGDVLKAMKNQEPYSYMRPSPFLDNDLQAVSAHLQDRGYAKAVAKSWSTIPTRDAEVYDLEIVIEQGTVYHIQEVRYQGVSIGDLNQIAKSAKVRANDIYSRSSVQNDAQSVKDYYHSIGFIDADAIPNNSYTGPGKLIVNIHVTEGSQFFLGPIAMNGLDVTHSRVIRNEIQAAGIQEGQPVNLPGLNKLLAGLRKLTYLSQVDGFLKDADKETPGIRAVELTFKEFDPSVVTYGIGYQSIGGRTHVQATIDFKNSNFDPFDAPSFRGAGLDFTMRLQLQPTASSLEISLGDRDFFGRPLYLKLPECEKHQHLRSRTAH